jgi:hypothetical protein
MYICLLYAYCSYIYICVCVYYVYYVYLCIIAYVNLLCKKYVRREEDNSDGMYYCSLYIIIILIMRCTRLLQLCTNRNANEAHKNNNNKDTITLPQNTIQNNICK